MPYKLPMNFVFQIAVFVFWALLTRSVFGADDALVFESDKVSVRATTVVAGLEHPWALAFLPNEEMLITERPGRLRWYENGKLHQVNGLPEVTALRQGGLLDIVLHPNFVINRTVCFSYSGAGDRGVGTEIACAEFDRGHLSRLRVIFRATPKSGGGAHFGSRLLFGSDGYLYATLGDRGARPQAQDLGTHPGSVVRITDEGLVPPDNPFVDQKNAQPEIFTYGNRNPQGMALELSSSKIWIHEHGPRGGDELNVLYSGANYGWPVISFGKEYWGPIPVGEGTHKPGMQQPVYYWVPSIAPSGMTFYSGDRFPEWRGNLFIGSLKFELLVRLELDREQVVNEEHLLIGAFGRIRDVREGPDGFLYLLTDERDGKLIRLEPAN
jgi:glucose/arabinose dehydrogenase